MTKLNTIELSNINGGGPLKDIYDDICYFVNDAIPSFIDGFKKGWASC